MTGTWFAPLADQDRGRPYWPVAVCRELTKQFEEIARGPAKALAERFSGGTKGEITVVIGPADVAAGGDEDTAVSAVEELVAEGVSRRSAADVVSRVTGVPRNRLYRRSL